MNVDKFGHHVLKRKLSADSFASFQSSLKITSDGDLDCQKKRVKNVLSPVDLQDSATKGYVDALIKECHQSLISLQQSIAQINLNLKNIEKKSLEKSIEKKK